MTDDMEDDVSSLLVTKLLQTHSNIYGTNSSQASRQTIASDVTVQTKSTDNSIRHGDVGISTQHGTVDSLHQLSL